MPCIMASLHKAGVFLWVANVNSHGGVPLVGDRRKPAIKRGSQPLNNLRQWVAEVLVLAAPETVSCHDNTAAK